MPLVHAPADSLARVYAQSLFDLAEAEGGRERVESVLGELESILELARQDKHFDEFLASRVLKKSDRDDSIRAIFAGKTDDLVLKFLLVLNGHGRLPHLPAIVSAYDTTTQERFGRVEVDVFTANPMDPDDLKGVRERLEAAMGREAIVHPYTEPGMLGGVKLQIGDRLIDGSLATKLRRVREQLAVKGSAGVRAAAKGLVEDDA